MVLRSLENYFVFVFVLHIEFGLRYNVVVKKVNSLYSEEKNCCPYWLNKAMHKRSLILKHKILFNLGKVYTVKNKTDVSMTLTCCTVRPDLTES